MDKEKCECDCDMEKKNWWNHRKMWRGGGHGHLYGLGIIGALFYFLQSASGIQGVVVGIVKAVFWPSFLVFKALELLKV